MRRQTAHDMRWTAIPGIGVFGTHGVELTAERLPSGPEATDKIARYWALHWSVTPTGGEPARMVALLQPDPLIMLRDGKLSSLGIMPARRGLLVESGGSVHVAVPRSRAAGVAGELPRGRGGNPSNRPDDVGGMRFQRWSQELGAATAEHGLGGFAAALERHLDGVTLRQHPDLVRVGAMADAIRSNAVTRVDELAGTFHLSTRTIQRSFARYLGVSPKWILRCQRVLRGAYLLHTDHPPRIRELAARLGYFDDSHFSRDFSGVLGCSPSVFARQMARPTVQTPGNPTRPAAA